METHGSADDDSQAPHRKATVADTLLYKGARNTTAERSSNVHETASRAKGDKLTHATTTPDVSTGFSPYGYGTPSGTNFVHHGNSEPYRPQHD
jgi:hypothetical protein